jgi:hypothetical protein
MEIDKENRVVEFSRDHGQLEWTGLALMERDKLVPGDKHVYFMFESLLPIRVMKIRTKEVDTVNDYENALRWFRNGCIDKE